VSLLYTYSDGGARGNPGPSAIGVVLCDAHGKVVFETARCIGDGTNNKAEYQAMILALTLAKEHGAKELVCYGDSELIIFQLQGKYRIKDAALKTLAEKVKSLATGFAKITYRQVPREHPMIVRADKLLNRELDRARTGASAYKSESSAGQQELF
jgi:ribonuclease HI